jgi:hypothetical protein
MTKKVRQSKEVEVYQLKIVLSGIKPPIWRSIQVKNNITLPELHRIIQTVLGWQNYHLHSFLIQGVEYAQPNPDLEGNVSNETYKRLRDIVSTEGEKFEYLYDFGDNWEHEVTFEKVLPVDKEKSYPVCLEGQRACPPEDCGGVWGYDGFLQTIGDENHEEHDEMLEWVGGEFDPEEFDVASINKKLKAL